MGRFILNLRRRDSVRNKELRKVDMLSVPDRVKQLKMNHVFKIKKQTCPTYMISNYNRLKGIECPFCPILAYIYIFLNKRFPKMTFLHFFTLRMKSILKEKNDKNQYLATQLIN